MVLNGLFYFASRFPLSVKDMFHSNSLLLLVEHILFSVPQYLMQFFTEHASRKVHSCVFGSVPKLLTLNFVCGGVKHEFFS